MAARPTSERRARGERVTVALVFCLLAAVYALGRERELHDARFALLTAESLATGRGWDLRPYLGRDSAAPEPARPRRRAWWARPGNREVAPYQLVDHQGRWIYFFPPGTPLLTAPIAAVTRVAGLSVLGPDGLYRYRREERLQAALAALATAATAALLCRASRRVLPRAASLALTLGAGLGTSLLSVASRNLWSHTGSVLVGAAVWLELQRWEDGERPRPAWLGVLLVTAFWLRPSNAFVALGCAIFVASRHRPALARLASVGAAGVASFLIFARSVWGEWLPPYYLGERAQEVRFDEIPAALAGLLLSPTRGLVALTPLVALAALSSALRPPPRACRPLAALAAAIVAAHLLFYAVWDNWRAEGSSFGPRLLTDVVPWLVALGAYAVAGWRAAAPPARGTRLGLGAAVAVLGVWSVVSHGAGAFSPPIAAHVARVGALDWTSPADWAHAPAVRVFDRWRSGPSAPERARRPDGPGRPDGPDGRRGRARPPVRGTPAPPAAP